MSSPALILLILAVIGAVSFLGDLGDDDWDPPPDAVP